MQRKRLVLAAVLIGVLVFTSGFFSYRLLVPTSNGRSDSLGLQGYVVIKAYHPDGTLYATWQGHNNIYGNAVDALSQCLSGESNSPNGYGTDCSQFINQVWISGPSLPPYVGTATNALTPTGCNPVGNPGTCTGWVTTGTVDFANYATAPFPLTLNEGGAGYSFEPFDIVNLSITANTGDRVVFTITFSIS